MPAKCNFKAVIRGFCGELREFASWLAPTLSVTNVITAVKYVITIVLMGLFVIEATYVISRLFMGEKITSMPGFSRLYFPTSEGFSWLFVLNNSEEPIPLFIGVSLLIILSIGTAIILSVAKHICEIGEKAINKTE